jgi:hypothetical protein
MDQPLKKDQTHGPPLIINTMSSQDANGTMLLDICTMVLFAITLSN